MQAIVSVAHWIHGLIHYWTAFLLVVLVGLIQTYLTIHSGKLSIPKVLLRARQRKEARVFYIWGLVLCSAIILVAILNDRNQFSADSKADTVISQGATFGQKFDAFLKKYLDGPPPAPSKTSQNDLETYYTDLRELKRLAQQLSSAGGSTIVQAAGLIDRGTPQAEPPLPASQIRDKEMFDRIQVTSKLSGLADTIRKLDTAASSSRSRLTTKIEQELRKSGGEYHSSFPIPPASIAEVAAIDKEEMETYVMEWIPQIDQVRTKARDYLSPSMLVEDEKQFESASTEILKSIKDPDNTHDLLEDYPHKTSAMAGYLRNLSSHMAQQKLR